MQAGDPKAHLDVHAHIRITGGELTALQELGDFLARHANPSAAAVAEPTALDLAVNFLVRVGLWDARRELGLEKT